MGQVGNFPTWVQLASNQSKSIHTLSMGLPREMPLTALFANDEIPSLSLTRITPAYIARMFQHHRQPELPAST